MNKGVFKVYQLHRLLTLKSKFLVDKTFKYILWNTYTLFTIFIRITMKQRLNITLQKEVYSYLKRNRKNISRYVEELVTKDVMAKHSLVAEPLEASPSVLCPPTPVF